VATNRLCSRRLLLFLEESSAREANPSFYLSCSGAIVLREDGERIGSDGGSFIADGSPLEAIIESRWVEAKSRTRGMDVHGDERLSGRRCWHSIRG
jgi:hypothetical protein